MTIQSDNPDIVASCDALNCKKLIMKDGVLLIIDDLTFCSKECYKYMQSIFMEVNRATTSRLPNKN